MSNIVIIPTYKESENIEALVKAISSQSVDFDILIIDDHSPDNTGVIVKNLQSSFKNLYLIERFWIER
jgi:dolichol-phosphate mannosyltransferase